MHEIDGPSQKISAGMMLAYLLFGAIDMLHQSNRIDVAVY